MELKSSVFVSLALGIFASCVSTPSNTPADMSDQAQSIGPSANISKPDSNSALAEKEKNIWALASNNDNYMTRSSDLPKDSAHIPFVELVEQDTATMSYDFPLLQRKFFVHVATSEDKNLRIYSWDTGMGASMACYDNICQYRFQGDIKSIHHSLDSILHAKAIPIVNVDKGVFEGLMPDSWINEIYDLHFKNGRTGYLIFKDWRMNAGHYVCAVEVAEITENGLEPLKCFKVGMKRYYSIGFGPDLLGFNKQRVIVPHQLEYDPKTHVLRVPIIEGFFEFKGYEPYLFNGYSFVRTKKKK